MNELLIQMVNDLTERVEYLESLEIGEAARVYHSANQAIGPAPWTVLTFDSEWFDTHGLHESVVNPSRLTATRRGVYQITAQVVTDFDPGSIDDFASPVMGMLMLNGGAATIGALTFAGTFDVKGQAPLIYLNGTTLYLLEVGDYVEVWVWDFQALGATAYALPQFSAEFMMALVV